MAQPHSNLSLFGLDLAQLPDFLRQGWAVALRWPFFARWLPPEPVRLRAPDGDKAHDTVWPHEAGHRAAATTAFILPEDILLRRILRLPFLPAAARLEAIELALAGATPFPLAETVWGWRAAPAANGETIELVLASRAHVAAFLGRVHGIEGKNDTGSIEVWAAPGASGEPVIVQGYGEGRRRTRTRRRHAQVAALFLAALLLLLALAASPVARMRQDVFDLNARIDAITREVAPVAAEREALAQANLQLQAVAAYLSARPEPVEVLGQLSALLPDSAYLTHFDLNGRTVSLNGQADNAAELMETLGGQPGFSDVRAPTAITRNAASGQESFSIRFHLDETPPPGSPPLSPAPSSSVSASASSPASAAKP
jgi:general secretion pathway protein L